MRALDRGAGLRVGACGVVALAAALCFDGATAGLCGTPAVPAVGREAKAPLPPASAGLSPATMLRQSPQQAGHGQVGDAEVLLSFAPDVDRASFEEFLGRTGTAICFVQKDEAGGVLTAEVLDHGRRRQITGPHEWDALLASRPEDRWIWVQCTSNAAVLQDLPSLKGSVPYLVLPPTVAETVWKCAAKDATPATAGVTKPPVVRVELRHDHSGRVQLHARKEV